MTRKKFGIVLLLVISLLFFGGTIGNLIMINTNERWFVSKSNTTEYMATVIRVEPLEPETGVYGIIWTEEYGNKLTLFGVDDIVDMNDLMCLQQGQQIFFRIPNYAVEQFEETHLCGMVSLRTAEKEIVSLERMNERIGSPPIAPTIASIIICALLLLLAIHCILLLNNINVFSQYRKKRQHTTTRTEI